MRKYCHNKALSLGGAGGSTPLNPHRIDELESRLWTVAVRAINRHDPTRTPLVPFVKAMVSRSAPRECARVFNAMLKAAENAWADRSLDEPIAHEDGSEESLANFVAEEVEETMRRQTRRDVHEILDCLDWQEQLALGTLMYADRTEENAARQLGVSRPTFRKFRDEVAVPHFVALWELVR